MSVAHLPDDGQKSCNPAYTEMKSVPSSIKVQVTMPGIAARINQFNSGRRPELIKLKRGKMQHDVFAFFRGSCHLFYEDLPATSAMNQTPPVWICGDLHLQNYGLYQGDDGLCYFDINDFDESLLAPAAWDIARFLTGLVLGFPDAKPAGWVRLSQGFLDAYTTVLAKGQMRAIHTDVAFPALRRVMQKRQRRSPGALLKDYTVSKKKIRHIKVSAAKMPPVSPEERARAAGMVNSWRAGQPEPDSYEVHDVGSRIAGLGSMGVERYLVLVDGDGAPDKNGLLELKQRLNPAALPYTQQKQPDWSNAAERVVVLQSRLQGIPPEPLAALVDAGQSFTLRALYPADEKVDLTDFSRVDERQALVETMGKVTAYAHLRGSGLPGSASVQDLIRFAADTAWQKTALEYAQKYSQQVAADYREFCEAGSKSG